MDKEDFFACMKQKALSDYEVYLKTDQILSCQKEFHELCNEDELQFQIVHQVEEMLLKLMGYTLVNIREHMMLDETYRVLTLFQRVHLIQKRLLDMMDLLETMSPADYQAIRLHLGAGSGVTSPGFKTLMVIFPELWKTFAACYLEKKHLTIEQIYSSKYCHDDSYSVAEALAELDELYHRFFKRHLDLIARTIGDNSKSLRGRPVETLRQHAEMHLFPELWDIRNQMTDAWGQEYGIVRPGLGADKKYEHS